MTVTNRGGAEARTLPWAPAWLRLAALASLVVAVTLVYARTSGYGFVMLDDFAYVVVTPELREGLSPQGVAWAFTTFRGMMWMPLTWLSYMAEIEFFGIDPGVQHVTNLVLHAINALLLHALALRLLHHRFAAWAIAMLFAVHPIHVESVAWIAERKDVLFGLFYLGALRAFVAWNDRPAPARYLLMLALGAGAMMSKPMAVSLPVAMLLLSWWPLGRFADLSLRDTRAVLREGLRLLRDFGLLAAMAAVTVLLTIVAAHVEMVRPGQVTLPFRIGNAVYSLAAYLWDLVLPVGLAPMYPLRPLLLFQEFLPGVLTVAGVTALAWHLRRGRPWVAFAWAWFVVSLLPVSGVFQMGPQARADRFVYMPAIGFYLALGAELARATPAWIARWRAPVAAVLAMYAALAWVQVGYWANPYMFSSRILDVVGDNVDAHVGLVQVYIDAGDLDAAQRHAEAAMAASPGHYQAYTVLGNILLARRDFAGAEKMFREALARRTDNITAWRNLGIAVRAQGREEEARELEKQERAANQSPQLVPLQPLQAQPVPPGDGAPR